MKQFDDIDIELLRKYDRPGPRYTSYPPAPAFSHDFTPRDFEQTITDDNLLKPNGKLSLYFHLPFCDTLCYFCGCNMMVTHQRDKISTYLDYIERDIKKIHKYMSPTRPVMQSHWGGGTPSYLDPHEILRLGNFIREHFTFGEGAEISVEIDPRGLTFEHMQAFREVGINRVSMGVQDFTPKVQQAINRIQPEEITRAAIDWSRQLGINSANLDLIYGLPFQTVESFEKSLDTIIDISPERLAIFNFAYVPWLKPHMRIIKTEDLPTPEQKLEILKMTIDKLTDSGYIYIGMDHFAKPTDELAIAQVEKTLYRNFQGYSTHADADMYSFGMSSISQINDTYAQNVKSLKEYYDRVNADEFPTERGYRMTEDDKIRRHVITRLMCDMELTKSEIERDCGVNFNEYFAESLPKLEEFIADGLLAETNDKYVITGMGRLLVRNIAMCFDAYSQKVQTNKPMYSRTV